MGKSSWRYIYLDNNKSFTLEASDASVFAYAIVRAPKGDTKAMFFPANNAEAIRAMIGLDTAHYPDIKQVINTNMDYGTFISAPAGSTKSYKSYYGGKYVTSLGLIPFYQVQDKATPNFYFACKPGDDKGYFGTESKVEATDLGTESTQAVLTISGISSKILKTTTYFDFEFWGRKGGAPKGTYRYSLDKVKMTVNPVVEGIVDEDIVCGKIVNGENGYKIVLGGTEANNSKDSTTVPYIDFVTDLVASEDVTFTSLTDESAKENILTSINSNFPSVAATGDDDAEIDYTDVVLKDLFKLLINIQSYVYGWYVQKGCTAVPTDLKITSIGYDKYKYDTVLDYVTGATASALPVDTNGDATKVEGNDTVVLFTKDSAKVYQIISEGTGDYDEDGEEVIEVKWTDITEQYTTSVIKLGKAVADSTEKTGMPLYYCDGVKLVQMDLASTNEDLVPSLNPSYNTLSFSCAEEVHPGEKMTGGSWTGSLDEEGTDENGNSIYFPSILSEDDLTFIEFHVVKTFDADLDAYGMYKGKKIIDKDEIYEGTLVGQRYMSYLADQNIKEGKLGCAWKPQMKGIITAGINEALKPEYEDVTVFYEMSGQDSVKEAAVAIRNKHKFATIVMEKVLTEAQAKNPSTVSVAARARGTAQYCNQMLYKDDNTSKKYYACPLGNVVRMLCRIVDKKYGGVPPMWTNDNGLGGQLEDAVLGQLHSFDDDATKVLDTKGINPISYDATDGVMILSSNTTEQQAGAWGDLGHSLAFDLFKREVTDKVMKYQVGKAIDDYYKGIRKTQTEYILEKRTTGFRPIWKPDSYIETDGDEAAEIFIIRAFVKPYKFSKYVKLELTTE